MVELFPLVHEKVEKLLLRSEIATELIADVQKIHQESNTHKDQEKKLKRELASYSSQLETLTERLSRLPANVPVELKDYEEFVKAMRLLWFNPENQAEVKEKIIKRLIARVEIDVDKVSIDYWMGKGFFRQERKGLELGENLKIIGSSTCQSGGPLEAQSQHFFLTIEVAEIIPYRQSKPYEDVSFLTDLYLKKGWSLRRISRELGCCKATVRKKLIEAGIEVADQRSKEHLALRKKIQAMRESGLSCQAIADTFNLWRISTRSGEGKWHGKTVREFVEKLSNNK